MAREIDMKELGDIVLEVVAEVEKDLEKVKAKEVDADEYADTLAHKVDYEKALKINPKTGSKGKALESVKREESKVLELAKRLRRRRMELQEAVQKEELKKENAKLKAVINKIKASKDKK